MCGGTTISCNDGAGDCGVQKSCNGTSSCTESWPGSGTSCDDGISCTGNGKCNGSGGCSQGSINGWACLINGVCYNHGENNWSGCASCSFFMDNTGWTPKYSVNDCVACGSGYCTSSGGCQYGAAPSCSDGDSCTTGDKCTSSGCKGTYCGNTYCDYELCEFPNCINGACKCIAEGGPFGECF